MLSPEFLDQAIYILIRAVIVLLVLCVIYALFGIKTITKRDYSLEIEAEHFFFSAVFVSVILMFTYLAKLSGLVV